MLQLNYSPFPNLESERLLFRQLNEYDVSELYRLRKNAKQMQYIPRPLMENEQQALEMIQFMNAKIAENTDINWAVCLKESHDFIGFMGFYRTEPENYRTEIGYMIHPEYEGKGYVTEAVQTLLRFGFHTLQFHSICAVIDPENIASERVLQKNGFRKEAHLLENEFFGGKFWDSVQYAILKREFDLL